MELEKRFLMEHFLSGESWFEFREEEEECRAQFGWDISHFHAVGEVLPPL